MNKDKMKQYKFREKKIKIKDAFNKTKILS